MGMLMTTAYVLAMDTFGPITDNAGGIAEFSRAEAGAREITDRLDAVGNTTKALTKGYAIASASLAAFLLFSAYIDKVNLILGRQIAAGQAGVKLMTSVDLSSVNVFIAALIAAMLVYFFSSLAIRAVGKTAQSIIVEVRRQFREMPGIMDYTQRPDYARVVDITTRAALREMVLPGVVAVSTPIIVGVLLGYEAVAGMLMVGTISGVMLATVLNNSGGAWDNAKKYIESGHLIDEAGNVLGKKTDAACRGGRRRHGRRPVQGHRRPVAPRPGQAAGDDHPGPRPALHPLARRGGRPSLTWARRPPLSASPAGPGGHHGHHDPGPGHGHRPGADRVPAGLDLGPPVVVPHLLGWTDPFITSPAFSVMLHLGTLVALLVYFWADWLALVPAGLAALRERSFGADPDRRLAWLLVVTTIPAVIAGPILNDRFEAAVRTAGTSRSRSSSGPRSCGWPTARAQGGWPGADHVQAGGRSSGWPRRSPSCPASAGPGSRSRPACSPA